MTIREAVARAAARLAEHPELRATAMADATLLLLHSLGIDRAASIAHPERTLSREEQAALERMIERRLRFEPMQYIVGTQEFFGLAIRVTPAVLIPRPETEILVEAVLARLPNDVALQIADVGTGSGAIAIALAHALPNAFVTAIDLSAKSLAVARENAILNSVEERIRWLESDLLQAIADEPPFDAIISNPPYVSIAEAVNLHRQVRDYEPAQALFAGSTGLEAYERLIPQAFTLLKPNGLLALEIGHGQRDAIAALLSGWREIEFVPDLQQIPRVAMARR